MENELISVIVPVYNIKDYLPKCFETITRQTYQNLEIILVDDGSTDGSETLCDELAEKDPRTLVIHQQNQGLWAARNSGKKVATGDYILFVDGDDYIHIETVEIMYKAINSGSRYDMAMIDRKETERFDEDILSHQRNLHTSELTQEELIKNMFRHYDNNLFVFQWNKLYRTILIKDIWNKGYSRAEDFDFNFRAFLKLKKAIWVHQALYYYVQRQSSLIHEACSFELHYKSRTDILFNNYFNLPIGSEKYKHLLLSDLYPYMFLLLNNRWMTEERSLYRKKCLQYNSRISRDFWKDREFPLPVKIKWITHMQLIRVPFLMTFVDRVRRFLHVDKYDIV